jgi:hypothetical protein
MQNSGIRNGGAKIQNLQQWKTQSINHLLVKLSVEIKTKTATALVLRQKNLFGKK